MAAPAPQFENRSAPKFGASILAVLLLAFALRIALALAFPTFDWPDEIFQTTEPAHRLAFGNGVVTWEWREGLRNWVFPGFLAAVMRLTSWMAAGSAGYLRGIAILLAALSLAVVWVAYRWSVRLFGASGGLIAALTCAVWYDLVYYGPKALNEIIAAHLLIAGSYLGYWSDHLSRTSRLIAAGVLLGATVGLRVQLTPAVLVALIFICYRLPRRPRAALLGGAVAAFLVFGLLDAITWSYPFWSYIHSLQTNLFAGKSRLYGVEPWNFYWGQLIFRVGWLLPFSLLGARRSPALAAIAATVLLTHSALAHKEYRFIYPAVMLVVVLAGFGIAESVAYFQRAMKLYVPSIAIAAVLVASLSVFTWHTAQMNTKQNGALRAFQYLSSDATTCGVGLRGPWPWSGGYSYLHRNVPIVPLTTRNDAALGPAFNVLITTDTLPALPPAFQLDRCWGQACLYRRTGGCTPDPKHEINAYLLKLGQ